MKISLRKFSRGRRGGVSNLRLCLSCFAFKNVALRVVHFLQRLSYKAFKDSRNQMTASAFKHLSRQRGDVVRVLLVAV